MPDLPPSLAYLDRPLAGFEAALRGGADAEDLDARPLERALKRRLEHEADPAAAVAGDLAALEAWLGSFDSDDHAGWCVVGIFRGLLSFGFDVAALGEGPDPGPQPTIAVEAPPGWTAEASPASLALTKGRRGAIHALIIVAQPGFGSLLRRQWRAGGVVAEPVAFGPVSGEKLVSELPGPVSHKQVQYELDVPGGSVMVTMGRATGRSFDETELEAVLHTLRVRPPASGNAAVAVS
ncbi:hypothetical protein [Alienimonas sp. DA493]|uniref:hypothetical protein n=1 Tax=Alienimonas sp. DA493 TaxID=3373605 RepID=UPI0037546B15